MGELGFWSFAKANPDAVALIDADGTTMTRGALLARCNQLVHGLRALGLRHGDCIATVLPNGAPALELYLAAAQAGWYLTPINHHLTGPEIGYILQDSDARALVVDARFAEPCSIAMAEAGFPADRAFSVGAASGFRPYEALTDGQSDATPEDRKAGMVMNYTSGTTGKPKGVRRRLPDMDPDSIFGLYALFLSLFGIEPEKDNVHLCGSPLYHTAVLMFTGGSLHFGHSVVVMDKWTPELCLEAIGKYRVTTSHMVPTQFHRLLGLPEEVRAKYDVSSLRHMIHAAAPCPPETKRRMLAWWGPTIYEYYAASEGGGTIVSPTEWLEYPGTVGKAWPTAEIRILDEDGNDLPTGQTGTVYMKLGQADFEYHKDKDKTEKNRRAGFFTVGDVGFLNEAGYLFLCDRKIDMIISGGVNIYPAEIEAELAGHPKIADVAVFGIPNEDWGEEVKAVIEPAPGVEAGEALAAELLDFCAARLAKYKRPKSIDFVAEMPRDPSGKLFKRKLRDPYWQGREKAI
jgi:long-chain acyl-CoA synthetase